MSTCQTVVIYTIPTRFCWTISRSERYCFIDTLMLYWWVHLSLLYNIIWN